MDRMFAIVMDPSVMMRLSIMRTDLALAGILASDDRAKVGCPDQRIIVPFDQAAQGFDQDFRFPPIHFQDEPMFFTWHPDLEYNAIPSIYVTRTGIRHYRTVGYGAMRRSI